MAGKQYRIYCRTKKAKQNRTWNKDKEKEFKAEEEKHLYKLWEQRIRRLDLPGGNIRAAIGKCFEEWTSKNNGEVNYHLTQLLSGHGSFRSYLQRIKKVESALCNYCGNNIDDSIHTLSECEEWQVEREELKIGIDNAATLDNLVKALCSGEKLWGVVNRFARTVMGKKEEDERVEQQEKRNLESEQLRRLAGNRTGQELMEDSDDGEDLFDQDSDEEEW